MDELVAVMTPAGLAVVLTILFQFVAIVWGAATLVARLKDVADTQKEIRDEMRKEVGHLYGEVSDVKVRLAVAEALHEYAQRATGGAQGLPPEPTGPADFKRPPLRRHPDG